MKLVCKKMLQLLLALTVIVTFSNVNPNAVSAAYSTDTDSSEGLYTVTLSYDPSTYQGEEEITSVGFLGSFVLYPSNLTGHTDETGMIDNVMTYTPHDYKPDMALMGGSYFEEMVYDESSNLYKLELQLPEGAYIYHYVINPVLGDPSTEDATINVLTVDGSFSIVSGTNIADPDYTSLYSTPASEQIVPTFYVGPGSEVPWNPISDEAKRGKVSFEPYTDVNGNTQNLGIYLPANYDANSSHQYKVIFASHGYGGDETHWFTLLGINNIMDNLIAEGRTEEAIVVTMNNTAYNWDLPLVKENVLNYIIPFIEENYNVSSKPEDRAFCGLSMGSRTTLYMYMNATSAFNYYGAFSGGFQTGDGFNLSQEELSKVALLIGCGEEDFAYDNEFIGVPTFMKELDKAGLSYTPYFVTGAHDMFTWPQMYAYFVENTLWNQNEVDDVDLTTEDTQDQNIPKTGENSDAIVMLILVGAMAISIVVLTKRRKSLMKY